MRLLLTMVAMYDIYLSSSFVCVSVLRVGLYNDVTMGAMAFEITSLMIVYSTVYSGADQRKHQTLRHWPVWGTPRNSPHIWLVPRKMFPLHDVIMWMVVLYFFVVEQSLVWLNFVLCIQL